MEGKKSNPWKWVTFLLLALVIIFSIEFAYNIIQEKKILSDLVTPESMCSRIRGTPSWADYRGSILGSGLQQINDSTTMVDGLINQSIYLLYAEGCSYCDLQIEYFGDDWERYKESGLAINCNEVKNG